MSHTNAINSSLRNPAPTREEEMNRFRESQDILEKFLKTLFAVIVFMTTAMGEALFISHPKLMVLVVLMFVMYYLLWLLGGTMLPHRTEIFPTMAFRHFMLVIGSFCSVLILTIISPLIAWLTAMLWIIFFAVTFRCCYQEFYELAAHAIFDTINKWIDSYKRRTQSRRRLPV